MINYLYAMFNTLACRFGDVFTFPSDAFAIARINDMFNIPNSPYHKSENVIYKVGSIDLATGLVEPITPIAVPFDIVAANVESGIQANKEVI